MNTKKTGAAAGGKPAKPMTPRDAARIQSAEAKASGGAVSKRSFSARAARAASANGGLKKPSGAGAPLSSSKE